MIPLRLGDSPEQMVTVRGGGEAVLAAEAIARQRAALEAPKAFVAPDWPDLTTLSRRTELKAMAARLGAEAAPADRDPAWKLKADGLRAKAVTAGASGTLWPLDLPAHAWDAERLGALAACLDNVALAARAVEMGRRDVEGARLVTHGSQEELELLLMFAEAQSSLRLATEAVRPIADDDQNTAFRWLRLCSETERVYIPRFMRLEDPGKPEEASDLRDRLTRALEELESTHKSRTEVKSTRNRARYHAKRILQDDAGGDEADWGKLVESAEVIVRRQGRGSAASLLSDLMRAPQWEKAPDALKALLAADEGDDDDGGPREYSANVQRVRPWLEGARIVMVGGERRSDAVRRIEEAFGVREVEWVSLSEHASSEPMLAEIASAETRLVLVLVKLAGHQHIDDARRWSREYAKPFVVLEAGYNPERIAHAVLEQVSERFASAGGK